MTNKATLKNKHTLATPILLIVVDQFGTEALEWEAEVLWGELDDMAQGVPQTNKDKISALSVALTGSKFYDNVNVFNSISFAIGGADLPVNFKTFNIPTLEEVLWTIHEVILNDPLSKGEELGQRFHPNIRYYLKSMVRLYGFLDPPKPVDFLNLGELPDIGDQDKTMMDAIYANEKFRKDRISDYMHFRYKQMMDQLEEISLDNGDTSDLVNIIKNFVSK